MGGRSRGISFHFRQQAFRADMLLENKWQPDMSVCVQHEEENVRQQEVNK